MIILPGDPQFDWTLATTMPPGWREVADQLGEQCAFVCEAGSGIMRPASPEELNEYLYGGEYDERMEDFSDEEFESDDDAEIESNALEEYFC